MASVVNLVLYGRDSNGAFTPLRMDSNGLITGSVPGVPNPPPIVPAQVENVIHAILCAHTDNGIRPVSLVDGKFPIVIPDGTGGSGVSINWSFLSSNAPLAVNQAYLIAGASNLSLAMPNPVALNDRLLIRSEVGSQWTIAIESGTIVRSSQGDSTTAIVSGEGGGFDAVCVQLLPAPIWFLTAVYGNLQSS